MKVLIAIDSFKGSGTSLQVSNCIEQGIKNVNSDILIQKIPLADGGEGTVDSIVSAFNGRIEKKRVMGPLQKHVMANFGIIKNNIAIIEMAEASGITLIEEEQRNPFEATSYGTGELIKEALNLGVEEIILGLGGSATNDGGIGMAQALGVKFKDKNGRELAAMIKNIPLIEEIDLSYVDSKIKTTKISVYADVNNTLCGVDGATHVYGIQKGVLPGDIKTLDNLLRNYGEKLEKVSGKNIINKNGSGAAGGLGASLLALCDAKIYSGTDEILRLLNVKDSINDSDIVITGEGKMDSQSVYGKAPIGVSKIAEKLNKTVIAIVGSEGEGIEEVYKHGVDLVIDIINQPMTLQESMENFQDLVFSAGERAARIIELIYKQ